MNLDAIQPYAANISEQIIATSTCIGKLALAQINHAVEWLQLYAPVAMQQACILAEKVAVAAQPHLEKIATWSLENQNLIVAGLVGYAIGTMMYQLTQRSKA